MYKNSTQPILLQKLFELLERHRTAFGQVRIYWRVAVLVLGELFNFGRHTVTQGLMALEIGANGIDCSAKGGIQNRKWQMYF
jgi:hypothetical protein